MVKMEQFMKKQQFSCFKKNPAIIKVLLLLLFLAWPLQASGQKSVKKPPKTIHGPAKNTSETTKPVPKTLDLRGQTPQVTGDMPESQIFMEVTLNWTDCQIHRVNTIDPLEIILDGTIESNSPEIWTLSSVLPKPEITPDLHFVSGVNGEAAGDQDRKAPLEWMISLNKGMFEPMTVMPDNSMTYTFPPGKHSFQVRIRGKLEKYQANGYYHLQLAQSFVPQL